MEHLDQPTQPGQLIKDCIYRFLLMPRLCRVFADTREFQRLREIRQLGIVHFVYPSAVHSRLEHSLGVMHLAGKVVDVLRAAGTPISSREKELVQLAGLLHDVGHIALSHFIDHMLKAKDFPGHEERSVMLLEEMNDRLGELSLQETATVAKMIRGDTTGETRPFLFQIVANRACGLDVDRLDYLQRDSYHAGQPGSQPDYLIECARVHDGQLAFLKKARHEVELMYQARARMFRQVYRHPTVVRVEQTLIEFVFPNDFLYWVKDNWRTLDDVSLMSHLRRYPGYDRLYTRNWSTTVVDPLACCVPDEKIQDEIDGVVYV